MKNVLKWGCISVLSLFAFIGIGAVILSAIGISVFDNNSIQGNVVENKAESIAVPTYTPTPTNLQSDSPQVNQQTTVPTPAPNAPTTTPNPTPDIPFLEILSSQSYIDRHWFHIVGEVKNNSNQPMQFVEIVATLYDDNDNVTGTDFTYAILDIIPPNGKSPFSTGTDSWTGTTKYKLQVQGQVSGKNIPEGLEILSHNSYTDGEWLHVRGEVKNNRDTPVEFVQIVITLYDVAGQVVGTDFTYTSLDTINPGGVSPFESGTSHWPNFATYSIQVEGR